MTSPQEALQKAREQDGWTEWTGGDRPHHPSTTVEVRFRDGRQEVGVSAFAYWWHEGANDDILAYRLHTPAPSSSEEKP